LQDALNWQLIGNRTPIGATTTGFGVGVGPAEERARLRSAILTFMTVDSEGGQLLQSGLLSEVRVTADVAGNALIVTGPSKSMGLIAALIRELDTLPAARAQIKVFTIVNGDATPWPPCCSSCWARPRKWGKSAGHRLPFLTPGLQTAALREHAAAGPLRSRPTDQQHHRHRLGRRSERGRSHPPAVGRAQPAQAADGRVLVGQRAGRRRGHGGQPWLTQRTTLFQQQVQISPESPTISASTAR
jgi:hypothetical protein